MDYSNIDKIVVEEEGIYLMFRIRPIITVMEIQVDTGACRRNPLGQVDIVGQVIVAVFHPHALPDRVDSIISQDGFQGLGLSGQILVGNAGLFFNEDRRDIRTLVGEGGVSQKGKRRKKVGEEHFDRYSVKSSDF